MHQDQRYGAAGAAGQADRGGSTHTAHPMKRLGARLPEHSDEKRDDHKFLGDAGGDRLGDLVIRCGPSVVKDARANASFSSGQISDVPPGRVGVGFAPDLTHR